MIFPSSSMPNPSPRILLHHSSHEDDRELVGRLCVHLCPRFSNVEVWHQGKIAPGTHKDQETKKQIEEADVALLLLSADYLFDDKMHDVELAYMLERHRAGKLRIIPVLSRPCDWEHHPRRGDLQVLPRDGKAIWTRHKDEREQILADIVNEVREILGSPAEETSSAAATIAKPRVSEGVEAVRPDTVVWIVKRRLAKTRWFRAEYAIYRGIQDTQGEVQASWMWAWCDMGGLWLILVSIGFLFHLHTPPNFNTFVIPGLIAVPLGARRALIDTTVGTRIFIPIFLGGCGGGLALLSAMVLENLGLLGWRNIGLGIGGTVILVASELYFRRIVPGVGGYMYSQARIPPPSRDARAAAE